MVYHISLFSFPESYSIPDRGYRATVDLQDMQNEQEINADCGKSPGFEDSLLLQQNSTSCLIKMVKHALSPL